MRTGIVVVTLLLMMTTAAKGQTAGGPFAVVELYTSESCSSCPPADKLLAELAARGAKGEPYFCLNFHVDYHNHLDWVDGFSARSATQRQSAYMRAFRLDNAYTPQFVINGSAQVIGGDGPRLEQAVAAALRQTPTHRLALHPDPVADDGTVRVAFDVSGGGTEKHGVLVAVVQRAAETDVKRGENAGKHLKHAEIVRDFRFVGLAPGTPNEVKLKLPEGVNRAELSLVGVIQHIEQPRVTGAGRVRLVEKK